MFDLHIHSICSDGSETPAAVADMAKQSGLELFALTDHDSIQGVPEAAARANEIGLNMLSGAEMEASYPATLHLLCLGMDITEPGFIGMIERQREYRLERNVKLSERLAALGMDVSSALKAESDSVTRAHYARALVELGYAADMNDAYARILGSGCPAYIKQERLGPAEVVKRTRDAGGVVVLAHPMKMRCEPSRMVAELSELGLWGIEAHYYSATPGEIQQFSALGRAHGLFITCGSDFHGRDRPLAVMGGCCGGCDELKRSREELNRLFRI